MLTPRRLVVFILLGALLTGIGLVLIARFDSIPNHAIGISFSPFTHRYTILKPGPHLFLFGSKPTCYPDHFLVSQFSVETQTYQGACLKGMIQVTFRIRPELWMTLHRQVGPDFKNHLALPNFIALSNQVLNRASLQSFYTNRRILLEEKLLKALQTGFSPPFFQVTCARIVSLRFSKTVNKILQRHLQVDQTVIESYAAIPLAKQAADDLRQQGWQDRALFKLGVHKDPLPQ